MEFKVETQYGYFKVNVSDDTRINLITRESSIIGKLITVDGINRCVGINAPYGSDTAELLNVKRTGGGCELNDKEISGKNTVGMVSLAFTFLRKYMPQIKYITLSDNSNIPCKLKNGDTVGVSLAEHQLIFHQKTWYERYFNAILINEDMRTLYEKYKENFKKKPGEFDFKNPNLNEILRPILDSSPSWKDFFDYLDALPNKCEIIYLWYPDALSIIFNNISFASQRWRIDLSTIEDVEYKNKQTGGSSTKSRKTRKIKEYPPYLEHISYDDTVNYKFKLTQKNPLRIETSFPKGNSQSL